MLSGTPALVRRERRLRQVRLAEVAAAAGGITTLVAGAALADEFGPGALLAAVGGLAVLVAASLTAQRLRRTVRYRIDRPHSTAWLAGKVAALLAGLVGAVAIASAVDAPSLPRTVIVLVVVGALAAVVNTHAARWTLFQVDATGLRLGRAAVPWTAVARLELAGPEIGVRLVPGQVVSGEPVPGRVLADLPVATTVPAVDADRLRWSVAEFGNPAIPVVVRDQAPPHNAPPDHTPPLNLPAAAPDQAPPGNVPVGRDQAPPHSIPAAAPDQTPRSVPAAAPNQAPPEDVPVVVRDHTPPHSVSAAAPDQAPPNSVPAAAPDQTPSPHSVPVAAPNQAPPPAVVHDQAPPQSGPVAVPPPVFGPVFPAAPPIAGPFPQAARSRRGWVVGGVLALAAVVAAGVVTAVAVGSGDEPGQAGPERGPRYSAATVEDPCDLIDVYVLKRWSTEQRIVTEPSRGENPDYDWLHCGAHSDSRYLVGRVTHLELVIAVAEDAGAARRFHTEQEEGGLWTVSGDVREEGAVDGLGESAEFQQAISTYADHTRTDYVLRLRDDNLSLSLKIGSDADQSDGAGVTVSTLADAARTQARGALEKLRARPAPEQKGAAPAEVPKAVHEAVTLPSTADLMTRIRAADPCALHDRATAGLFGRVEVEPHQALGLAECRLMAVSQDGSRVGFGIRLNEYLTEEERADLAREEFDGQEVFRGEQDPSGNGCRFLVLYGTTGFGAEVSVARYVPGAADQAPWPEACEYTAQVAPEIAELPARQEPVPEPTLVGKDPCVADEVADELMPDWELGPVGRYQSAQCRFTMTQGDETYEFDDLAERTAAMMVDGHHDSTNATRSSTLASGRGTGS